jgi:hypothetical protein
LANIKILLYFDFERKKRVLNILSKILILTHTIKQRENSHNQKATQKNDQKVNHERNFSSIAQSHPSSSSKEKLQIQEKKSINNFPALSVAIKTNPKEK